MTIVEIEEYKDRTRSRLTKIDKTLDEAREEAEAEEHGRIKAEYDALQSKMEES